MKRITLIALLFLTAAPGAWADTNLATGKVTPPKEDENSVSFFAGTDRVTISGVEHPLVLLKDRGGIIVNETCARGESDCLALKALKYVETKNRVKGNQLKWGRRLGAILCSESKGGVLIVGNDPKHNELAVCYFDDGTFVWRTRSRPITRPSARRPARACRRT